ncbi:sarcosine oxidase, gamma subunit family [Rhizobium freirei PRF 81]|uniref:Sarcosine oxidase, gamma subunit family n=1 Tax=Rhizobium freirei PRF 81 TaxID=363754 RepID=N6V8T2_9HYPH|nr:sarcosine oxidase subunit gamma [Rhizobium freirei]ENN87427.1 sarcosine oxidase, gamma subunit family [Rhizobium freirei PRF 81]
MADLATRKLPLSGRHGGSATVRLTPAAPASRISLRAPADSVDGLSHALGLQVPTRPKTSASNNGRHALWLGPDEWLVIDENGADLVDVAASAGALHSATNVSHRNTAVIVSGPGAEATLAAGCSQDVSLGAFPVGACSRTLLGKAEVVILRLDEETFRVEVWRSFSDYAFGLLAEGAEDAGL